MTKKIVVFSIIAVSVTALILVAVQIKNKPSKQYKQAAQSDSVLQKLHRQAKINPNIPRLIKISSQEITKIEEYAKEFNMPIALKEELLEAGAKGNIDTQWGENKLTEKELDEAGLSLKKIAKQKPDTKTANITAGYRVTARDFKKMVTASCLSQGVKDTEQTKELKSQALAELGFSALAEQNNEQAKQAFENFIENYPEMPQAPMINLEYALLFLEEGRRDEAWKIVDEAIHQNQNDKEFIAIADDLLEEIKNYE